MMIRNLRSSTCWMILLSFCWPSISHGDLVYEILPVQLSNGFAIAGGTITTDGAVGEDFGRSSITNYEIVISGPVNFTFLPTNQQARIFNVDPELVVTATEIYFPALPQGETADFRFDSRVQLDALANFSVQQVFWNQGSSPTQRSQTGFISLSSSNGTPLASNGQGTNSITPMLDKFVIARIDAVPEPSSGLMLLVCSGFLCFKRRRSGKVLR